MNVGGGTGGGAFRKNRGACDISMLWYASTSATDASSSAFPVAARRRALVDDSEEQMVPL